MKKVSVMLVAALLLSTGSIFANDSKGKKPAKSPNLSEQIGKFLNKSKFHKNHLGDTAQVLFMLNSDKEIVVLSVDTEKEELESIIKSRLNYQEVDYKYEEGKKYTVTVRIAS